MSTWLNSFSRSNPDSDSNSDAGDGHPEPSSTNPAISPESGTTDVSHTVSHRRRGAASTSLAQLTGDRTEVQQTSRTASPSDPFTGVKNDLAEFGDSIKELLSSSSNIAATGISSFASNFLKFKKDEGIIEEDYEKGKGDDALEIDKDVLDFARKISMRPPEVWTEFPIAVDEDFDMSDSQRLHAATIENLVPGLASLRRQISGHVSSEKFWLIYFILLLPSLNEDDMRLLCSPKIVEAREKLILYFQNNSNATQEEGTSSDADAVENADEAHNATSATQEVDKYGIETVIEADSNEGKSSPNNETRSDDSLVVVSRSDHLDDKEEDDGVLIDRASESSRVSSASDSNEWIRLKESSGAHGGGKSKAGSSSNIHGKDSESEDLGGWLNVDETDV